MADPKERDQTTITVNRDFARLVRTIADQRDITMAEVLDRFAGPAITREYRKALDAMQAHVVGGES